MMEKISWKGRNGETRQPAVACIGEIRNYCNFTNVVVLLIMRLLLLNMAQNNLTAVTTKKPIPVAARSKALVCGRSPAEIAGSNPTGDMDVCL
jgi:hypothetical protein